MSVTFFAPLALRGILQEMSRDWPGPVETVILLNPEVPEAIRAGRSWDVAMSNPHHVWSLIADGLADADSHVPFGRVPLAVAAPSAPERSATTTEGIAALLRGGGDIAYTEHGTSGRLFRAACERLGILDDIAGRLVPMGGGGPIAAVAGRDVALAIAPLSTVLAAEGVAVAGIFPDLLETTIEMSVCTAPAGTRHAGARALVDWLTAPDLDPWLASRGVARFDLPE